MKEGVSEVDRHPSGVVMLLQSPRNGPLCNGCHPGAQPPEVGSDKAAEAIHSGRRTGPEIPPDQQGHFSSAAAILHANSTLYVKRQRASSLRDFYRCTLAERGKGRYSTTI